MIGVLASDGPDEDWVRRAQAGDRKAFSELVRRHQDRVYRYLLRMLGSHDDALGLTQDALVKAWQALPQWQPEAQFRTWRFRAPTKLLPECREGRRSSWGIHLCP